jgi:hypothetical protein
MMAAADDRGMPIDMSAAEVGVGEEQYRLEEKKLVRKVDWILMPILTITLGLQVCH